MIDTITEKRKLVHEKLFPACADIDTCIKDYKKLEVMTLDDMNKLKTKSRCGDNLMKHYFKHYTLDISTHKQPFTFFEICNAYLYSENPTEKIVPKMMTEAGFKKLEYNYKRQFDEYTEKKDKGSKCQELTPERALQYCVEYWGHSCVGLFSPYIAKKIYLLSNSKSILDPFCGWGGRLIGSMAIPEINYIGFDTNIDLKKPYADMITKMNWKSRVKILFKDSSTVDFSKYEYDTVFTSPPYRIEYYKHEDRKDDEDVWYNEIILKTFNNAWNNLKIGGKMIINVNKPLYKKLIKTFGESEEQININNSWAKRNKAQKEKDPSKEYAYVWTKKEKNNKTELIFIEEEEIDYENFECFTEA